MGKFSNLIVFAGRMVDILKATTYQLRGVDTWQSLEIVFEVEDDALVNLDMACYSLADAVVIKFPRNTSYEDMEYILTEVIDNTKDYLERYDRPVSNVWKLRKAVVNGEVVKKWKNVNPTQVISNRMEEITKEMDTLMAEYRELQEDLTEINRKNF